MMVGSIEPFIRGLYNVAPKCKKCGEIRQYWGDELCVKCRLEIDKSTIPVIPLPPVEITREDVIWAIRHPNRKKSKVQWQELKSGELTPEEEKILIDMIEYHKESLKLLAE